MRLARLTVRGFRNLADTDLGLPPEGLALLGRNGQGKTSLLEAIAYPVLFRSFRTARDGELATFGGTGFHAGLGFERGGSARQVAVTFRILGRRKQLELDGVPATRVVEAAGAWLGVVFAPEDVRLASGPAAGRRLYLDRTLSLADRGYLTALSRYRAALAQRNAALRQGRGDLAQAFDRPLADAGATVVAGRLAWVARQAEPFARALVALGEQGGEPALAYDGDMELAEPGAWGPRLEQARARDLGRGVTTVGPHRDDLVLRLDGHLLRDYGSTGQVRSAAIALKLLELETLEAATGEAPALLLDDVFAELDAERQRRLATRLFGTGRRSQVFITAPRPDELPEGLALPRWQVEAGRVVAQD
ncbi:MAG: DNA replication and repair protein RecF [Gemmatimonadetes bacterium]|nr:DNA replication and repair protein RecF [Gemmatimonadota bacterium]